MVKIMVPTVLKWDDLGVPLFLETPIWVQFVVYVGHIADSSESNTSGENVPVCPTIFFHETLRIFFV